MGFYYTVDSKNFLKSGLMIEIKKYDDVRPIELQEHVDKLFPDGFTNFGERYFLCDAIMHKKIENQLELVFEYVRRSNFPTAPSRFQSVFGFDTTESARVFIEKYRKGKGSIWKVEADKLFKADMNLLHSGSLLRVSYQAHTYWSGNPENSTPFWEFLLSPPVKVIDIVE